MSISCNLYMKEVKIQRLQEQVFYGLRTISNDKHMKKDLEALLQQVKRASGSVMVMPYIVCMKEFYQDAGEFQLFIGSEEAYPNLEKLLMGESIYAVIELNIKLMQSWSAAIHEIKHHIYKWSEKH